MHCNLISGSEREEPMCKYLSMSTQTILFPMPAYTYPHYCCLQHRGSAVEMGHRLWRFPLKRAETATDGANLPPVAPIGAAWWRQR